MMLPGVAGNIMRRMIFEKLQARALAPSDPSP
jgi:hypothetical protein